MTREHYLALLKRLDQRVIDMGAVVSEAIGACVVALKDRDAAGAQDLIERGTQVDELRYDIEREALLIIATQQPLAGDLRTLAAVLTIATELERIGDYCEGIAKLTLRMVAEPDLAPLHDIETMAQVTQALLHEALRSFAERDLEGAGDVWTRDDEVDELYGQVFRRRIAEMIADTTTVRAGTYMLWVAHNIERMADRITNIAERVAFIVTGDVTAFRGRLRSQSVPD